jgi:quinolinate synthase
MQIPLRPPAPRCSPELARDPWAFDGFEAVPSYGPGASEGDVAPLSTPRQSLLPELYRRLDHAVLHARIVAARARLGQRLLILGHHYQRDEIICHADFRGDSFKLAQQAASRPEADFIVFCGVHFMAESADLLRAPHQQVLLPNMAAGCSMADMAHIDDVLDCWDVLETVCGPGTSVPLTYMNSAAALKAFCGEREGLVCTSSNAEHALSYALGQGERVLFFPDQHLGRNTGVRLGIPLEQMLLWDPRLPLGGNTAEQLRRARLILWRGWCSVHKRFTVAQIAAARRDYPGITVIVHPECELAVVQAADMAGSTEFIIEAIAQAPAGSQWAVGTEISLVRRLAAEYPDKLVFCLDPVVCPCSTMYRIHPAYLAWVLEGLVAGQVLNEVRVPEEEKRWARVALERMLALPPAPPPRESAGGP